MTPHVCLPQTMTPENLAKWITDNQKDIIPHVEETDLTDEEIRELEHKSAMASSAIDELKEVEKHFKEVLKNGTDFKNTEDGNVEFLPETITIPPTKGLAVLEANRKYANDQLRDGVKKHETPYYLIPFPEESLMVAVDIEGQENEAYTRAMTEDEERKYALPILKTEKGGKKKNKVAVDPEEAEDLFS